MTKTIYLPPHQGLNLRPFDIDIANGAGKNNHVPIVPCNFLKPMHRIGSKWIGEIGTIIPMAADRYDFNPRASAFGL